MSKFIRRDGAAPGLCVLPGRLTQSFQFQVMVLSKTTGRFSPRSLPKAPSSDIETGGEKCLSAFTCKMQLAKFVKGKKS